LTIASGVDTANKHSAFVSDPTDAGASSGRAAELRTNVLLGATGASAVATGVMALMVDWHPRKPTGVSVGLSERRTESRCGLHLRVRVDGVAVILTC
jgi:hypothetical protein